MMMTSKGSDTSSGFRKRSIDWRKMLKASASRKTPLKKAPTSCANIISFLEALHAELQERKSSPRRAGKRTRTCSTVKGRVSGLAYPRLAPQAVNRKPESA